MDMRHTPVSQCNLIATHSALLGPTAGRCEPPRAPQPPTTTAAPDGEAPSGTHPQCATTAADTAASPPHAAAAPTAPQFPDEQLEGHQQQLSAFEQRLSFLELELLKQSISSTPLIPAAAHAIDPSFTPFDDACDDSDASPYGWDDTHHHQGHHPGRSRAQDYALAATGLGGTSWGQAPSGVGAAAAEQLDPEVLAVAELLLARQGLPLSLAVPPPDSCSAAAPSGTPPNRQPLDSTLQSARQVAACTGGAQHPGAARRRVAAAAAGMVAPSSIWGVGRHALRQQGRQQSAEGVAGSARVAGRRRAGRRYGGGAGYGVDWEGDEDMGELAPYEPNDLAAAGLIIAVSGLNT